MPLAVREHRRIIAGGSAEHDQRRLAQGVEQGDGLFVHGDVGRRQLGGQWSPDRAEGDQQMQRVTLDPA